MPSGPDRMMAMHGAETGANPWQNSTERDSADMIMQARSWEAQQVGPGGGSFLLLQAMWPRTI